MMHHDSAKEDADLAHASEEEPEGHIVVKLEPKVDVGVGHEKDGGIGG